MAGFPIRINRFFLDELPSRACFPIFDQSAAFSLSAEQGNEMIDETMERCLSVTEAAAPAQSAPQAVALTLSNDDRAEG